MAHITSLCLNTKVTFLEHFQEKSLFLRFLKTIFIINWIFSHLALWNNIYYVFLFQKIRVLNVLYFIPKVTVVLTWYALLFKWKRLLTLWERVSTSLNTDDLKRLKLIGKICCAVIIVLSVLHVSLFLTQTALIGLSKNPFYLSAVEAFTIGINKSQITPNTVIFLYVLKDLSFDLGNYFPLNSIATFFACMSLSLAKLFQNINNEVENLSNGCVINCMDFVTIRQKYRKVRTLIAEADGLLSSLIVLWFLASLITTCIGIITFLEKQEKLPWGYFSGLILHYSTPLFYSAFITYCADFIPKALQKAQDLVSDLPLVCICGSQCISDQRLILIYQLSSQPKGLTIGGLFVITKNIFVSHFGCIITFTVLLLQLYPKLMDKLRG